MKDPHPIQLKILKKLVYAQELRYSQLKPDPEMENNQFDFHLDSLITSGYIIKLGKVYSLTNQGKEYIGHIDGATNVLIKQAKTIVLLCCLKTDGKSRQYLIHTRTKHPFFGRQGFPGGKVSFGEKTFDAAARELQEETGMQGKPELVAVRHYLISDRSTKTLLDDFYIYLYLIQNPAGKLEANHEGTLEWIKEEDLDKKITNHIENCALFKEQIKLANNFKGQVVYQEIDFPSEKF